MNICYAINVKYKNFSDETNSTVNQWKFIAVFLNIGQYYLKNNSIYTTYFSNEILKYGMLSLHKFLVLILHKKG